MATIREFHDLEVWKRSRVLCHSIYECLLSRESVRDYALKDQINRASASVMDNIAEGFGRQGNKEFRQYLAIARGSLCEVRSQLFRAVDRGFVTLEEHKQLEGEAREIESMIVGFSKYLVSSKYAGSKFKVEEPPSSYDTPDSKVLAVSETPKIQIPKKPKSKTRNSESKTQNPKLRTTKT